MPDIISRRFERGFEKNEYAETEMLGWTAGCYCVLYDYLKDQNYEKN